MALDDPSLWTLFQAEYSIDQMQCWLSRSKVSPLHFSSKHALLQSQNDPISCFSVSLVLKHPMILDRSDEKLILPPFNDVAAIMFHSWKARVPCINNYSSDGSYRLIHLILNRHTTSLALHDFASEFFSFNTPTMLREFTITSYRG
ncbi:unnamed protein product [Somion occarium]|uniref:Uncharacterized protein n=1 Tax=Somion occarium TaxID=3059160 RepID=A0ABP1E1I8_9APHY